MIRSVGIVGHGAFGALTETLLKRFCPSVEIRIHSSRSEPDGKRFFTLEAAAQCDAVVLATPIRYFEETLQKLLPLLREDTAIVDVATVKVHTVDVLKRLGGNRRYIATHPMFGPESYTKREGDISGFRIVLSDSTLPSDEYEKLRGFLKEIGFDVVQVTADQHDKHLAESLFLTHFIGQVVSRAGFDRTEIDTVSFGYLMDAVESVRHDSQLFADVYAYNPYCKDVLKRFEISEEKMSELLKSR